jgi:hypothetical protein
LRVQRAGLGQIAVKGPIQDDAAFAAESKHSDEPIFHRAAVEILDDMNDFR